MTGHGLFHRVLGEKLHLSIYHKTDAKAKNRQRTELL